MERSAGSELSSDSGLCLRRDAGGAGGRANDGDKYPALLSGILVRMDRIPAPRGTVRRKVEYVVIGLACAFGAVFLFWVVYVIGGLLGLWGNFGE